MSTPSPEHADTKAAISPANATLPKARKVMPFCPIVPDTIPDPKKIT